MAISLRSLKTIKTFNQANNFKAELINGFWDRIPTLKNQDGYKFDIIKNCYVLKLFKK